MFTTITIQPHVTKKLTPKQLLPLPWEEERQVTSTAPKSDAKRIKEIVERVR